MSERYSRVFSLPENQYTANSPIIIEAGALQKDNQTGNVLAQLKMKSISSKGIKAVKVNLKLFDISGAVLFENIEYQYLDLEVTRDESFGSKSAIRLSKPETRSFSVSAVEVFFDDGSTWSGSEAPWESLSKQTSLINSFNDVELVRQYEIKYGSPCYNVLLEEEDLWHCTCGAINRDNETKCYRCGKSLNVLKEFDLEDLVAEKERRLKAERIAAEAQAEAKRKEAEIAQQEKEKKKRKNKKIAVVMIPLVCVAIACVVALFYVYDRIIIPNNQYNTAATLMDGGKYNEAITIFSGLGDYRDSSDKVIQCQYQMAEALFEQGDYKGAIAAYEVVKDYGDSAAKIEEAEKELMYQKYAPVIEQLKKNEWYRNGGADDVLQKLTFTDRYAKIETITFDGNGKHNGGTASYGYTIDDQFITLTLGSSSETSLEYRMLGGTLELNYGTCMTKDQIKNGLQGGWRLEENSFGVDSEYNVIISGNTIKSESANEGFYLGKGQYYYYGPYSGTFNVGAGSIQTDMSHGNELFFNIVNGKATLLHYHHPMKKTPMRKLPGANGYYF